MCKNLVAVLFGAKETPDGFTQIITDYESHETELDGLKIIGKAKKP